MNRRLHHTLVLSALMLTLALSTGCKPASEKAEAASQRAAQQIAAGHPDQAMDSLKDALSYAESANRKKPGSVDTAALQQRLAEARQACITRAGDLITQAQQLAQTDPFAAQAPIEQAKRLIGTRYGNDTATETRIREFLSSPSMEAVRVAAKMNELTDSINSWLAMRSSYESDWGNYWSVDSFLSMMDKFSELDAMLGRWEATGNTTAGTARRQLQATQTAFTSWRTVAALTSENSRAQGLLLINFLVAHRQLKNTLRATRDISTWTLSNSWGISSSGSGYSWTGTGNGNTPGNPGSGGTGNGGTGGTGNGGTGNGGTGNGGTRGTGTGGTGGTGSTGNGGTSGPHRGTSGGPLDDDLPLSSGGSRGTGNGSTRTTPGSTGSGGTRGTGSGR